MTAPRTKAPETRRREILEAARRLVTRQGAATLRLDDVAREAGVAKGTIFLYYATKEDLIEATFADLVEALGRDLDALSGRPPEGLLAETARVILIHFDRNRDFISQLGAGACAAAPAARIRGLFAANLDRVEAILRRLAKAGVVKAKDPAWAAGALVGLCRTQALLKVMRGGTQPLESKAGVVVEFFLHGARGAR